MNDLIKKLKEQATSYTWNGNDVTEELDEEKFAELIVGECADQVDDYFCDFYNKTAADKIKEHFGVEE